MADIQYSGDYPSDDGYESGYVAASGAEPSRVTQLVNWAGALVSMGLVIGMGVWAFQLLVRDVADVPVIRALEGPMRIQPENPGGSVAENQGLAVNRLAEGEEAAPVPDQLVLAPPPMDLAEVAPLVRPEVPVEEQAFENGSEAAEVSEEEVIPAPAPATDEAEVAEDDTSALIERLLSEAQPLEGVEGDDMAADVDAPSEAAPDIVARATTIPISIPGVRRSPRPMVRPADLPVVRAVAVEPAAAGLGAESDADAGVTEDDSGFEIASAELETGTRLVQLGAFDTPELARTEWARLAQVYPDFFTGRARVVEQASSGGQVFYRLRAHGFSDLSASRRFCAALIAQGAACIPVTVR